MLLRRFIWVLTIFITSFSFSQISGIVIDAETNEPISDVLIKIKPYNKWAVTKKNGTFNLSIQKFPVSLEFSFLGKTKVLITVEQKKSDLKIKLQNNNLKIEEVVVTAKTKKESTGSNVILGKQAINLTQALSIADVMQLLPGNSISESELHERQLLSLRTAFFNDDSKRNVNTGITPSGNNNHFFNNTFGVGYVIDDVPIDNDVNLTGGRSLVYGLFNNTTSNSSVGLGLDLKNLSLNNIESVEVVQGISSAKYGNHSTGLIKINRAHGASPFTANANFRNGSYTLSLSKGIMLTKEKGFLNLGLDYLKSNSDPRFSINNFDRFTFNTSWSYRKENKMRNRLNFSYAQNINNYNQVATSTSRRKRKNDSKRFRLSNNNSYYINNNIVDAINSVISFDYSINNVLNSNFTSYGGRPILNALEEGTYQAIYTPVSYWAKEEVDSKPFSFFSRLEAEKTFTHKSTIFKIDAGITFKLDKNFGKGNISSSDEPLVLYDVEASGGEGFRNINFNAIFPSNKQFSAYATSTINTNILNKKLTTNLGIRYDNYNKQTTFSPRLNTALEISKNIKTRFGFGLFSKAPSLQALYPNNVYYDFLIADYRTNNYSFALAHTFVRNYKNENLKPSRTLKYDAGIDIFTKKINISLTGYYNRLFNGFTSVNNFEVAQLPTYNFTFYDNTIPDYTISGYSPVLLDYITPTNDLESKNAGIELLINTKKIKSINTSFNISAAYRYTKNYQIKSIIDIIP